MKEDLGQHKSDYEAQLGQHRLIFSKHFSSLFLGNLAGRFGSAVDDSGIASG